MINPRRARLASVDRDHLVALLERHVDEQPKGRDLVHRPLSGETRPADRAAIRAQVVRIVLTMGDDHGASTRALHNLWPTLAALQDVFRRPRTHLKLRTAHVPRGQARRRAPDVGAHPSLPTSLWLLHQAGEHHVVPRETVKQALSSLGALDICPECIAEGWRAAGTLRTRGAGTFVCTCVCGAVWGTLACEDGHRVPFLRTVAIGPMAEAVAMQKGADGVDRTLGQDVLAVPHQGEPGRLFCTTCGGGVG